jgi:hypothetical protein
MAVNLETLKADVEAAVNALSSVLAVAEELPLPASVKGPVETAAKVLADVKAFLSA